MKAVTIASSLALAAGVYANTPIPESWFTDNGGASAAAYAAPLWHMVSGSCRASAAEDGQGHQTNGVNPGSGECAVNAKLDDGCPGDSHYKGPNTPYENLPGEPFYHVPTYFVNKKCGDNDWRTYFGVYFKKDVGHESDFEWAIVQWVKDGSGQWIRNYIWLEVDGKQGGGSWGSIPSTFDSSSSDEFQDGNRNRNHPKLYFGKHHHAVHWDTSSNFKNSCSAGTDDFRANDFIMLATDNLRHINNINSGWNYGQATNPHATYDYMCHYSH